MQELCLDGFVLLHAGHKLIGDSLVLIPLILHLGISALQLCYSIGKDGFPFLQDVRKLLVLLVLLRDEHEVLTLEVSAVLLSD
jgi:hypothetical protein